MADLSISVPQHREKVESLTFDLGLAPGDPADSEPHQYTFNPPKAAVTLVGLLDKNSGIDAQMAQVTGTLDWLSLGMSDDDNARLLARLRDPEDGLDIQHLYEVTQRLTEAIGARPTM